MRHRLEACSLLQGTSNEGAEFALPKTGFGANSSVYEANIGQVTQNQTLGAL